MFITKMQKIFMIFFVLFHIKTTYLPTSKTFQTKFIWFLTSFFFVVFPAISNFQTKMVSNQQSSSDANTTTANNTAQNGNGASNNQQQRTETTAATKGRML